MYRVGPSRGVCAFEGGEQGEGWRSKGGERRDGSLGSSKFPSGQVEFEAALSSKGTEGEHWGLEVRTTRRKDCAPSFSTTRAS